MTPLPALIVAHGQPSDPAAAEADLAQLARAVQAYCGGRVVSSATLSQDGALAAALARLGPKGVVFPMFMAGGWFTRVALGAKLRAIGAAGWQVLEPFGCESTVHRLACDVVARALHGKNLARAQVLIAAHGSFKSSAPSDVANALANTVQKTLGLGRVEARFIDQTPRLVDAAGFDENALCLPFFAANGGHVTDDIPRALQDAGFVGQILPPLGLDAKVPALIAAAIDRARPVCAQHCRYSGTTAG